MQDQIRGFDLNMAQLWESTLIDDTWIGTGRDHPGLIRQPDMRAVIQFYLSWYPHTDVIHATIGNNFRICAPGQSAMSIIDAVMKELNHDPDSEP